MLETMIKESLIKMWLPSDDKYIEHIFTDLVYYEIINDSLWNLIGNEDYMTIMVKNCDDL